MDWELKRQEDAKKLIENLEHYVNDMSMNPNYFIEEFCRMHRTNQQSAFRLIFNLIAFAASDKYLTDGRNEDSKEVCKQIINSNIKAYLPLI